MARLLSVAAIVASRPDFFGAPRFTKPSVGASLYSAKDGGAYFVTGDKLSHQRHVAYTVRLLSADGTLRTIGDVAGWKRREIAERQAEALAKGFPGLHSVPNK